MTRFRTSNTSTLGRDIADKVSQAKLLLEGALRLCEGPARDRTDLVSRERVKKVRHDLLTALGAVVRVRPLALPQHADVSDKKDVGVSTRKPDKVVGTKGQRPNDAAPEEESD